MIVYTDGSFTKRPPMGGMGAVIVVKDKEYKIGCYSQKCADNNVAEIAAIAMAIQFIKENHILDKAKDKTITLVTDSEYAIHRLQNLSLGRTPEEQDMLDYINDFRRYCGKKFNMLQVKGHQASYDKLHYYNNEADKIAGMYRHRGLAILHEEQQNKLHTMTNFILNQKIYEK